VTLERANIAELVNLEKGYLCMS